MLFNKNILCWEILILIFVHLFLADGTILIFCTLMPITVIAAYSATGDSNPALIIILLGILAVSILLKFIYLPLTYNLMEKKSKKSFILNFIKNLKNNNKFKLRALFFSLTPYLIFYFYLIIKKAGSSSFNLLSITYLICFMSIVTGVFGSYLMLFAWWKFRKAKA